MTPDDVDLTDADRRRIQYIASGGILSEDEAERIVRFAKLPRDERYSTYLRPSNDEPFDESGRFDSKPPSTPATRSEDEDDQTPVQLIDGYDRATCAAIRVAMSEADRPTDIIAEFNANHPSVIYRHAQGRCGHDNVGVEPTTSPRIDTQECADMRRAYRFKGKDETAIAEEFARSPKAVNAHVFGSCGHGDHYVAACDRDSKGNKD